MAEHEVHGSDGHHGDEPRHGLSRRGFLGGGALAGGAVAAAPAAWAQQVTHEVPQQAPTEGGRRDDVEPGDLRQETSTFFATATVEVAGTYAAPGSDGDLWPCAWGDDDWVYTANGDGRGFSDEPFRDLVVNRVQGTPETGLRGEKLAESEEVARVWSDPERYNRKPTGIVCVGGVLYLAVQDLRYGEAAFDDAPAASISRSDDHGRTWTTTDEPMFTDHRFTTVFFADLGRDSEHAVPTLGPVDGAYVYAYGLDWNWRTSNAGTVPDPVDLYLARVPGDAVQDRKSWEFLTGVRDGHPSWSPRIEDKAPVLHDPLRRFPDTRPGKNGALTVVSQGHVLYNAPLDRFLYASWSDPTFELYEAPRPWGPWRRFHVHSAGLVEWYQMSDPDHRPKNGGYGTVLPSKYVSVDGLTMWMQSNWWTAPLPSPEDNYNFNLRRVQVTPWTRQRPRNGARLPSQAENLVRGHVVVAPLEVCAHRGNREFYNDGSVEGSEDSFDGTNKGIDYWGYTLAEPVRMNRVDYTSGEMSDDGGWFSAFAGGLRVQVRRDFVWTDVEDLRITPDYPFSPEAGPRRTFTLRFRRTWGDGVRIIGQPGGSAHFTSISELGVFYER
ncbi:DUF4185 domain-containing protein [Pseudokineococcus basanitobsidens]|uniref:DUF4185 domain-containing protein n=1 Tax=Pseudokineococcus basanitobsidens TaxID=1926649 RepID=A0ABU8RFY0_9ACTN